MKVTNESKARQGIHTATGLVWLDVGQTRDVEFTDDAQANKARRVQGVIVSRGVPPPPPVRPVQSAPPEPIVPPAPAPEVPAAPAVPPPPPVKGKGK